MQRFLDASSRTYEMNSLSGRRPIAAGWNCIKSTRGQTASPQAHKWVSERCERTSKRTSELLSTLRVYSLIIGIFLVHQYFFCSIFLHFPISPYGDSFPSPCSFLFFLLFIFHSDFFLLAFRSDYFLFLFLFCFFIMHVFLLFPPSLLLLMVTVTSSMRQKNHGESQRTRFFPHLPTLISYVNHSCFCLASRSVDPLHCIVFDN